MRFLDADAVHALGPAAAVGAISDALRGELDPATDPPRASVGLSHGQFLLMPSEAPAAAGVKVVTVAPDNPSRGLPRIQGTYLLFDRATLALRAVLDGTALTTLRTPAVSVAAVLPRLPDRPLRVAVVGAGPQATGTSRRWPPSAPWRVPPTWSGTPPAPRWTRSGSAPHRPTRR